ncbi:hypothetical protein XCR_3375 [Xanthomonas campestris pv. raphani 756C]|nr:hypothetical protein XCR_3375 [Xanthomonas campestris pv. raphani 756C]
MRRSGGKGSRGKGMEQQTHGHAACRSATAAGSCTDRSDGAVRPCVGQVQSMQVRWSPQWPRLQTARL